MRRPRSKEELATGVGSSAVMSKLFEDMQTNGKEVIPRIVAGRTTPGAQTSPCGNCTGDCPECSDQINA